MADTIFYGGEIITMDEKTPRSNKVEAVAVTGTTIVEVGSIEQVFRHKGPNTQMILLNGQTLMPGFIEPHQHANQCSLMRSMYTAINAMDFGSYAEVRAQMQSTLKSIADSGKNTWGLFIGWDPELMPDLPACSAAFLNDNFSNTIPIVVVAQNLHVAWANTAAFTAAGIPPDAPDPPGGSYIRDEDGNMTGQMHEEGAIKGLIDKAPAPSEKEMKESIAAQYKFYASVGFTTVTELAYEPNPGFDKMLKDAANDECPIRLGMYHLHHPVKDSPTLMAGQKTVVKDRKPALKDPIGCCGSAISSVAAKNLKAPPGVKNAESEAEGIGNFNEKLWEVGIKLFADGSPHCGTCAVREPFMNTPLTEYLGFAPAPQYGTLMFSTEAHRDTIKRFHQQGKQIAVHCHGERAAEQILKIYEEVLNENGDTANRNRHRMEHLGLMTPDQIARAGKINITPSFFIDHLRFYASVYKTDIFGDRVNRWTPLSVATKNGLKWTIHQDQPGFPGDPCPFSNMKTAITRCQRDDPDHPYGPEYRVSIHEALKAYTVNAAWQLHIDHQVGTITQGKKADLVILSDNPYLKDPFKLEEIKVVETFLNGRRNNIGKMTALVPDINVLKRDQKYDA